jgi:ssRNA-specific RNase YbeY (16S rRNA maturation enzyme)
MASPGLLVGSLRILNLRQTSLALPDRRLFRQRVRTLQELFGTNHCDLGIKFVGDATMRRINKVYRNVDEPTDVLSFPAIDGVRGDLSGTSCDELLPISQQPKTASPSNDPALCGSLPSLGNRSSIINPKLLPHRSDLGDLILDSAYIERQCQESGIPLLDRLQVGMIITSCSSFESTS